MFSFPSRRRELKNLHDAPSTRETVQKLSVNFLVKDDVINFIHKYTIYNNVTGFLKKKIDGKDAWCFHVCVWRGTWGGEREKVTLGSWIKNKQTIADIPFFPHEKWGTGFFGIHNQNGRKKYLFSSFLFSFFCHRGASRISLSFILYLKLSVWVIR